MRETYSRTIRQLGLLLHNINDKKMEPYGITMQQAGILGVIDRGHYEKQPITRKYIEKITHLKGPTVTGILNNLEKNGFIIRGTSAADSRAMDVRLTEKARLILDDLRQLLRSTEEELVEGFTDIEKNVLTDLLLKLQANLRKYEE